MSPLFVKSKEGPFVAPKKVQGSYDHGVRKVGCVQS